MAQAPYTLIAVGSAEQIRDFLCGPQQHNEHTKGWRWHLYMQDCKQREANLREGARLIIARMRGEDVIQLAAE